jgi:hypothetical protein
MRSSVLKNFFYFFILSGALFSGCAQPLLIEKTICPGAANLSEAAALLNSKAASAVTFRVSSARCTWEERTAGKKTDAESFNVKLWVEPPDNIYLQGDVAFDARGLILGSNDLEYWLAIKPKEISTYWWGKWSEQQSGVQLKISPKILLEGLGIIRIEDQRNWTMINDGAYDVLLKWDGAELEQKIYISGCERRVVKIEYFDGSGGAFVVAELGEHIELAEGFEIAGRISIVTKSGQDKEDAFTIVIKSAKPYDLIDKQREVMFNRPEPRGYKNIYRMADGQLISQ